MFARRSSKPRHILARFAYARTLRLSVGPAHQNPHKRHYASSARAFVSYCLGVASLGITACIMVTLLSRHRAEVQRETFPVCKEPYSGDNSS
jgi:hypothetical protein